MEHKVLVVSMEMVLSSGEVLENKAVLLDGSIVEIGGRAGSIDEHGAEYLARAMNTSVERVSVSGPEPRSGQWPDLLSFAGLLKKRHTFNLSCVFLDHLDGDLGIRPVLVKAESFEEAVLGVKQPRNTSLVRITKAACDGVDIDLSEYTSCLVRDPNLTDGYRLLPIVGASAWIQAGGVDVRVFDSDDSVDVWVCRHMDDASVDHIVSMTREQMALGTSPSAAAKNAKNKMGM